MAFNEAQRADVKTVEADNEFNIYNPWLRP